MLGILGAIAFGVVAAGAWASASATESKHRQNSRANHYDFYFDKNGRMRHTSTGLRYTPEEVSRAFHPVSLQDRLNEYDRKCAEFKRPQFYCTQVHSVDHFFLTKEEALEFVENYNKDMEYDFQKIKVEDHLYSRFSVSVRGSFGVCHFDYDKYIGVAPWKEK